MRKFIAFLIVIISVFNVLGCGSKGIQPVDKAEAVDGFVWLYSTQESNFYYKISPEEVDPITSTFYVWVKRTNLPTKAHVIDKERYKYKELMKVMFDLDFRAASVERLEYDNKGTELKHEVDKHVMTNTAIDTSKLNPLLRIYFATVPKKIQGTLDMQMDEIQKLINAGNEVNARMLIEKTERLSNKYAKYLDKADNIADELSMKLNQ